MRLALKILGLMLLSQITFCGFQSSENFEDEVIVKLTSDAFLSSRFFKAKEGTWLKINAKNSSTLPDHQKCFIPEGTVVELTDPPMPYYLKTNHYKVRLRKALDSCEMMTGVLYMTDFKMIFVMPEIDEGEERPYISVEKASTPNSEKMYLLTVYLVRGEEVLDSVTAYSGKPKYQNFRVGKDSEAWSYEPLPEGIWHFDPLLAYRGIAWAGGIHNYSIGFRDIGGSNLGPLFAPIYYNSGYTGRSEIGVHVDTAKIGTAGCLGIRTMDELKVFASWFDSSELSPQKLIVDWGLGSI